MPIKGGCTRLTFALESPGATADQGVYENPITSAIRAGRLLPKCCLMFGPEIQYGRRENFRDGFTSDDVRVQVSFKYSFNYSFGQD